MGKDEKKTLKFCSYVRTVYFYILYPLTGRRPEADRRTGLNVCWYIGFPPAQKDHAKEAGAQSTVHTADGAPTLLASWPEASEFTRVSGGSAL